MGNTKVTFHTPKTTGKSMWQIFVPVTGIDGYDIQLSHHQKWDRQVRKLAGGLTINKKARGIWQNPMTGKLFEEKMIPVLIGCSFEEMETILEFTLEHYIQEAVMCYKVSDTIVIMERT